jgi:hypothetical protein
MQLYYYHLFHFYLPLSPPSAGSSKNFQSAQRRVEALGEDGSNLKFFPIILANSISANTCLTFMAVFFVAGSIPKHLP